MSRPISNPTKTLHLEQSSSEVNEAIAFIPALSAKYKLVNADPALQVYTLSGAERSSAGVYIDIGCSLSKPAATAVTLTVRRKDGWFEKGSEVSMANQHMDTVFHLLSDSLALSPNNKSRLLSARTNEQTVGEHCSEQATIKKKGWRGNGSFFNRKKAIRYVVLALLLMIVFYVLYRLFSYP